MKLRSSKILALTAAGLGALLSTASAGFYKNITIDGTFGDWAGIPPAYSKAAPGGTTSLSYQDIYVANDEDYLYIRFTLFVAGDPFTSHENIFVDADANQGTGFSAGGRVGSEMLIQSGAGYQEKGGGFNEGAIDNLGWAAAPAAPGAEFEVRISRKATYHSDGAFVFMSDSIAILLEAEDASWTPVEFAPNEPGGLFYTFEPVPPPLTGNTTLVDLTTASWQVNASATDLGTNWLDPSYDDTQTGWNPAFGLFGFSGTPGVYPPINTPLATGANTYYFRTRFPWSFVSSNVAFVVTNYLSDGAVYYLNGAEVRRVRMPAGTVGYGTNATGTASPAGSIDLFALPAGPLLVGQNVLQVETHQASGSSQDMVFGLSLTAAAQFPVLIVDPALPADRSVVAGGSTAFRGDVLGSGPLSYQWLKDNAELAGETNATLTLPFVLPANAGAYALRVSNPLSTNTTRAAVLTVTGTPVVLTDPSQPADQTAAEGSSVTFTVAVSGSAPLQYQWFKGTEAIPGATDASHTIAPVRMTDAGSYRAEIGNPLSSTNSRTAVLTVLADKVPPVLAQVEGSPNQVRVTFSEPVDPSTASAPGNYRLEGGATVISVAPVVNNPAQVALTTSGQQLGSVYILTVSSVQDLFGNRIADSSRKAFLSSVVVDGILGEWQGFTPIYTGESNSPTATNIKDIYMYNDADYLYLRVTTWDPTVLAIWYNNFFFDTDNDPTTGYASWGGAEMLIQGGAGYQEKNGGFNEGPINGLGWLCEPPGPAMDFEVRISRAATYAGDGLPVFTTNVVNFAIDAENTSYQTVNRVPATGTLSYTLVEPPPLPPGPLELGYSAGQLQVRWTGPGTLQSSGSLSSPNWTEVPNATSPYPVPSATGQQYFRLMR